MGVHSLIPYVFVGAVVVAAVYLAARYGRLRGGLAAPDPGVGTVRRLYFYAVSFAALMMAANGVVRIVRYVIDALLREGLVSGSQVELAMGMSLALVGLPLWALHWRIAQRHTAEFPVERRTLVRKFYVYAVLGVSVGMVISTSMELLRWALGVEEFRGQPWGGLVVWGAVWLFHWMLERREGQPTEETLGIRRLYVYAVSLISLSLGAWGIATIAHVVLSGAYDAAFGRAVLLPEGSGIWRESGRAAIAQALVGVAAWAAHWLYLARDDAASALRGAYIFLFAVLGGLLTSASAAGAALYGVLVWALGVPTVDPAVDHFRFLPASVSAMAVGAGVWGYHWSVARHEARGAPVAPWPAHRVYGYLMAAVGLGALAIGAGWIVHTMLTVIIESAGELLVGRGLWREPLALGLTLLALGAPLWGYYWAAAQRRLRLEGQAERASLERRIFVFAALGAGAAAMLGSASALLFFLFRDALEGDLSMDTLRSSREAIDVIVAAAIFLPYYWIVYVRDQRESPPEEDAPPRKAVSLLANDEGAVFMRGLETALGYRLELLRWADEDAAFPALSAEQLHDLAEEVADAPGRNVLLVPHGDTLRVLSYD